MSFREYNNDRTDNEFNQMRIKNNVMNTLNLYRFIGNLFEMYLPQLFNVIVEMSKGSEEEAKKRQDEDSSS
ncbi:MAG: hypothetical protein AAF847_08970 [Bacteroidota bacterium]